jgi:hypothetical protein
MSSRRPLFVQQHIVNHGEAVAANGQPTRADVLVGFQEAIELARLRADPSAMIAGWREIGR